MRSPDKKYWQHRWDTGQTRWDIGYASPPLTTYIDSLSDKTTRILIPGCGNAYEAGYALQNGFHDTHVIDIAPEAITNFLARFPDYPKENAIVGDFFELEGSFDLILEQTFFCSLDPKLRPAYAKKSFKLLDPGGKLAGLLFDDKLYEDHPPFGGSKAEYLTYFKDFFEILHFETAYNSIKPRADRELFIELLKEA